MRKAWMVAPIAVVIGGALLLISRPTESPREALAHKFVRALAANNWDHAVIGSFLCDDPIIKDMYGREKMPLSFDIYREYGGIKAVGKARLTPPVSFPQVAMDTFIPVLFNKRFVPYPSIPDHIAYHAAYIQLATRESSGGQRCLVGWGRNDLPVDLDQAANFLAYRGIFAVN